MLSRLCWTCFVIECDSLSEFHLPRSGIEVAIDRMYFPRLGNHTDRDGLMFLALCSIRRLLNRIHNAVYASGTKEALSSPNSSTLSISDPTGQQSALSVLMSLEGVFGELERQLDVWYDSLPEIIKPDLSSTVPQDTQDAWLRLRYWSAKHIISRPSLIYATTWPDGHGLPGFVARYSAMCIESSRNYIKTGVHTLDKRTHFSWMTIQACLSNSMILSMAATTPKLQHLVPDIDSMLRETSDFIQPWASRDSSAEAVVLILRTLHHKMKFCILNAR
ncbi:hypothetical protein CEP52_012090 [Fusarium oligoseptatum]|uniref:Transcription factor domain-containing protein n=2 Tax=Fusarium solani species complex TaxID=232080 RepID=A0A428T050_9HYPO|nr:hypothetical protein CEP52_012090 [Fusarium oligoseptatum]